MGGSVLDQFVSMLVMDEEKEEEEEEGGVRHLMHQRSSSHERLDQCGTCGRTGSPEASSVAKTAHPSFFARLCANQKSSVRSPVDLSPWACRPYARWRPNGRNTSGGVGATTPGTILPSKRATDTMPRTRHDAPLTCNLKISLHFHMLNIAHDRWHWSRTT